MPGAMRGKAYKFARAFHGPFCIVEMMENEAIVKPVDCPQEDSVRVTIDWLRACPVEVPDQSWPSHHVIKPKKTLAKMIASHPLTELTQGCSVFGQVAYASTLGEDAQWTSYKGGEM